MALELHLVPGHDWANMQIVPWRAIFSNIKGGKVS